MLWEIYLKTRIAIKKIISEIYFRIFKEKVGKEVLTFMKNFGYISIAFLMAKILAIIFEILVARILKPIEYGKITIIMSIVSFLYTFVVFGTVVGSIKYVSMNREKKDEIFSTSFFLILISGILVILLSYVLVKNEIFNIFFKISSYDEAFFALALVFPYTLYYWGRGVFQSLGKFKSLGISEIILWAGVYLFGLIPLFFIKPTYKIPVIGYTAGYILVFIFSLRFVDISLKKINKTQLKKLISFGKYITIGRLSGWIQSDLVYFLILSQLNLSIVGLYRAHLYATSIFGTFFANIFSTIFFPTAAKLYNEAEKIYRKLLIFSVVWFFICIGASVFVGLIVMNFYGVKYKINIYWIILLAFLASLSTLYAFWARFLVSLKDERGTKYNILGKILCSITFILIYFLILHKYEVYGIILSLIISHLQALIQVLYFYKKIQKNTGNR